MYGASGPDADHRDALAVVDRGYSRPADVYLHRYPGKVGGQAIDVTVVSRWAQTVTQAEVKKRDKYADYLAGNPTMGFCPFALDLQGTIGEEAWKAMVTWARHIATNPAKFVDYRTAMDEVLGDIAWTFVDEVTRQIRDGSDVRRGGRYC